MAFCVSGSASLRPNLIAYSLNRYSLPVPHGTGVFHSNTYKGPYPENREALTTKSAEIAENRLRSIRQFFFAFYAVFAVCVRVISRRWLNLDYYTTKNTKNTKIMHCK